MSGVPIVLVAAFSVFKTIKLGICVCPRIDFCDFVAATSYKTYGRAKALVSVWEDCRFNIVQSSSNCLTPRIWIALIVSVGKEQLGQLSVCAPITDLEVVLINK